MGEQEGAPMDAALEQTIVQLQARVGQLEARLQRTMERLDGASGARHDGEETRHDGSEGVEVGGSPPELPPVTTPSPQLVSDRRQMLARAATMTAGAVAGGTALALVQASPAAAAPGVFDGNPAVTATGTTTTATGVSATSQNGDAVRGVTSGTGTGVHGESTSSGTGVYGTTVNGIAVEGATTNGFGVRGAGSVGVLATGFAHNFVSVPSSPDAVHVALRGNDSITPPLANPIGRTKGDIIFDSTENLWLCVQSGTPGTWRRLGGASSSGAFSVLATPVRVYDSRPGNPPAVGTKAPLAPNTPRACDLKANGSGIPAGSTAVLVSVVVTQTTGVGGGFLSVYRNGIAWPGTSNLNWSGPNQNVAVTTVTAVDDLAICSLYASQATHVVVDVLGFYR